MTFVVVCCGMPRSGSTWLYNATRLLLHYKFERIRSGWISEIDRTLDVDAIVVKVHESAPGWAADRVLLSHRDLRDAALSARRMGWGQSEADLVANATCFRRLHDVWKPSADLDLAYEAVRHNPVLAVACVAEVLGIKLPIEAHREVAATVPCSATTFNENGHDPVSLLHPGHVADGGTASWRVAMRPETVGAITARHADWLASYGYDLAGLDRDAGATIPAPRGAATSQPAYPASPACAT